MIPSIASITCFTIIFLTRTNIVYTKKPRFMLDLPNTIYTCFGWGGDGLLASGTKAGAIIVWDILASLRRNTTELLVNIHHANSIPIRSIAWRSLFDKHTLLASDSDGHVYLYDLRDPFIPLNVQKIRSKGGKKNMNDMLIMMTYRYIYKCCWYGTWKWIYLCRSRRHNKENIRI